MRMFDIISKKKYNESLSKEEIDYVINEDVYKRQTYN